MMTEKEALDFLSLHQPLPDEKEKEMEDLIEKFNEVRLYFLEHKNPKCIPLFLNCFGTGGGFGSYHMIIQLLKEYDDTLVIDELAKSLFSPYVGVRFWSAEVAQRYHDDKLIDGLLNVFKLGDTDAKCSALTALLSHENIVKPLAHSVLNTETDATLREIAEDIIQS